jgi:hypothetical protein
MKNGPPSAKRAEFEQWTERCFALECAAIPSVGMVDRLTRRFPGWRKSNIEIVISGKRTIARQLDRGRAHIGKCQDSCRNLFIRRRVLQSFHDCIGVADRGTQRDAYKGHSFVEQLHFRTEQVRRKLNVLVGSDGREEILPFLDQSFGHEHLP